jgi:hypothetical protein
MQHHPSKVLDPERKIMVDFSKLLRVIGTVYELTYAAGQLLAGACELG